MLALEELFMLSTEELESTVLRSVPEGFSLMLDLKDGWFSASLLDAKGNVWWERSSPDPRIPLYDAVGYFLHLRGSQPRHPAWQRRGEVIVPSSVGNKAHQAHTPIPDPEDLDPQELLAVYGLRPKD